MKKSKRGGDFHLKIAGELCERLERLAPAVRVRVKRGNTHRTPYMTELLVLAAEHLAYRLEQGESVLEGSKSFTGARQVDDAGDLIAMAPLASAAVYAELQRSPGVPTPEQVAALDADAALLAENMRVVVRGCVFHTSQQLTGKHGTITEAQRGRRLPRVYFDRMKGPPVEISPYDLIPEKLQPTEGGS